MLKIFLYILLSLAPWHQCVADNSVFFILVSASLRLPTQKGGGPKSTSCWRKSKVCHIPKIHADWKSGKRTKASVFVVDSIYLCEDSSMWNFLLNPRAMQINQPVCQSSYHNCVCWDRSARGVRSSLSLSLPPSFCLSLSLSQSQT